MANILSSREKKIIVSILNSASGITLQEISEEIGVSRRTVLREMSSIYTWFEKQGYQVERQSSKGLYLKINESERLDLLRELNEERIIHHYSKKERTLYIITELLQSKEPLKLSYFSLVLEVSEASISSDLNSVDEWLTKFSLELSRKQGYGIEVLGRERDKRRALVNIIYETLDSGQLRDAVQRQLGMDEKVKVTSKIRLNLLNMIDIDTITIIENAISKAEKEIGFKFTESSYTALAVHLALACKRIVNGETITIRNEIMDELQTYDEFQVASRLIEALKRELNIMIPNDEIAYVTLHLKGARYKNGMYDTSILKFNETIISNYELTLIVNKMIKIASNETGYHLKTAENLLIGLIDHLRPVISRVQLNLDIRNPLLEKIKTEYPIIFEAAIKASKVLEEELNFTLPESEIGYIAMHIGSAIENIKNSSTNNTDKFNVVVTCISGIGTSKMLAARLKKEFKNINIIEVFASTNIKDEWLIRHEIDIILSTVHHTNDVVPVLTVNPLLLDQDIKKVTQKLSTLTILRHKNIEKDEQDFYDRLLLVRAYSHAILEVIDNIKIISNLKCTTYEDFIDSISNTFTEHGDLLKQDILDREKISKIIFEDEHVKFLHARTTTVDKLYVGIFRNRTMIQEGQHHYDTALVLVAPKNVEKHKLEILGEISAKVVSEENFLRDLRHETEQGLYIKVQSFLQIFFEKKFK